MLLISQNIDSYNVALPENSVFRINLASSLDNQSCNPKQAHVDQIEFANKKTISLIENIIFHNINSIIIIQGDTGSAFAGSWEETSDDLIIEIMSNLNAIYFPDQNYASIANVKTPINTFRIIFNEFFDENYVLLENKMYWSTGNSPYLYNDVTKLPQNSIEN